jgi:hypothetical protein
MMRLRVGCPGVAFAALVSGCGDPNHDVTIAELKDGLTVNVQLLGTSSPPAAQQLYFDLVPKRASGEQCPVVAAKLTINGIEAEMTSDGSWNNSSSSYDDDGYFSEERPHCTGIGYQLPVDDSLRATARRGVAIEITDESGSFKIFSDDFVTNPEAVMVAPEGGKLSPGNLAVFTVTPQSFQLPDLRAVYFVEDPGDGFSMKVVEVRDDLFVLDVPENKLPSRGRISVEPAGGIRPLTMRPSTCDFAKCTIERTSCAFADPCRGTIAYDDGFDSYSIPAEVE